MIPQCTWGTYIIPLLRFSFGFWWSDFIPLRADTRNRGAVWVHASLAKQKWVMKCRLTSQWWVSAASSTAISSTTWSDSNRGKKKTDCALDNFLWFHALHEIISETNKDSFQKVRNQDAMNVHLSTRKHQPIEILSSAKSISWKLQYPFQARCIVAIMKRASYRTSASTSSSDERKNTFTFNCIDVFPRERTNVGATSITRSKRRQIKMAMFGTAS